MQEPLQYTTESYGAKYKSFEGTGQGQLLPCNNPDDYQKGVQQMHMTPHPQNSQKCLGSEARKVESFSESPGKKSLSFLSHALGFFLHLDRFYISP